MKCFDMNKNFCDCKVEEEVHFIIDKPNVPFNHKLSRRLSPNTTIIIQGVVDDNALRFEVNLLAGHGEKSDIVFHFNPRLEQLYTARNSRFHGKWGTEEGASQLKFPFRCGQPFHLEIYTTDVKYLVAVDGTHYCTYKHRAPVASVEGLQVEGGLRLSQVMLLSSATYPALMPQLLMCPEAKPAMDRDSAQGASVVYNLKSSLQPQSSIIVQGVVNDNAYRFRVDLLLDTSADHGEKTNIGFHFNPRLDLQYTARNARLAGVWGKEEGEASERFPFRRGQPFYLEMYATAAKFLVAVDGVHYCSYRYHVPLSCVKKVHVHGDTTLSNVQLQRSPAYPSPPPQLLSGSEDEVLMQAGDFTRNSKLKVPFTHVLKSRLHPQSSVIIQGMVDNHATRFEVNFIIGHDECPDIAFHFNPRLDKLYVARNSRFNGSWGHEEGHSERKFPFRCGQPFFLEIFLTESKFMVAVDGAHYCSFRYRASLVSVSSVRVEGGIRLTEVSLHSSRAYPTPMPECLPCPDVRPVVLRSGGGKSTPFIHKLDFRFYPQSSLIFQGEVANNGIRFVINLLVDYGSKQDIAFHFNPRVDQKYTARNSKIGGQWGTEEGSAKEKFPFRSGFPFNLEIFFTHSKLMVAVDGSHYCSFKYRLALAKITSVQVEGGVVVRQLLAHSTNNYPSPVLEFVHKTENKSEVQAVRAGSVSSISQNLAYCHELRSTLHPQSSIFVQGVVDSRTVRLEFNLLLSRSDKPDIAFHFNPRLDQFYSARNSRLQGAWGSEEGNSAQRFPFVRGKPFFLEIFLTHTEFMVAVNATHYCTFGYRTSLRHITSVEVCGVRETHVDVQPVSSYPSSPPESSGVRCPYRLSLPDRGAVENSSQITPVYGTLKGKLRTNSKIEIRGKVKLLPYSFQLNLQEGVDHWPHPLVSLHLSVRFCEDGRSVALTNSWVRKKWGAEERGNRFLFTPGSPFTITISCQEDKYLVHVDNKFLLAYKHRVPYKNVDTLLIEGDVFIFSISVHL